MGMGGSYVAISDEENSQLWNPAGIAGSRDVILTASASYPYGLKDLSVGSLSLSLPLYIGNVGINFQRYGNEVYRELALSLILAKTILKDLSSGISFRYNRLSVEDFGSSGMVSADLGLIVSLQKYLKVAVVASNFTGSLIHEESLSKSFTTGFAYWPISRITISADLYKEVNFPYQLHMGVEYKISENTGIRFGFGTNPSIFTVGVGFETGKFCVSYALLNHLTLGSSHHVSSTFRTSAP